VRKWRVFLSRSSLTFEGGEKKEDDAQPPLMGAQAGRSAGGVTGPHML